MRILPQVGVLAIFGILLVFFCSSFNPISATDGHAPALRALDPEREMDSARDLYIPARATVLVTTLQCVHLEFVARTAIPVQSDSERFALRC